MPEEKLKRVVIFMQGGLIQWLTTDEEVDVIVVDRDVENEPDGEDVFALVDADGDGFEAAFFRYPYEVRPDINDVYFEQFDKVTFEGKAKRYVAAGGGQCPHCGSDHIEGGSWNLDGDQVSQDVHCLDCHKMWADVYQLNHLINYA